MRSLGTSAAGRAVTKAAGAHHAELSGGGAHAATAAASATAARAATHHLQPVPSVSWGGLCHMHETLPKDGHDLRTGCPIK